jgi:two-component system phosphate regulon sensor histidine kinase PhoR
MGEGVLAIDSAGNVARSNAELRRAIGASEAIGGRALSTIFRNPELVRFLSPNAVPEEGRTAEFEVFGRAMLVTARRLPAGGVVAVFSDLTELRRLDQVRTEFVANASHELKTPLTAIRGFAETLLDANLASENRRTFSQRIVDHADRMAAIVEDLLTLARLEEPGHEISRDRIAIAPLVQRIIENFAARVRVAGMEIQTEIQPPELEVVADPNGLRQVLENLVDNALRHSNARVVGIRAGAKLLGQVTLTVWDDGSGIPSSQLDRIFERFYRVDPSRSRATGGTGLGLSIVRHWTESMGGRVWAESTLSIGTEIHVELPVQS